MNAANRLAPAAVTWLVAALAASPASALTMRLMVAMEETDDTLNLSNGDIHLTIDKTTGQITSLSLGPTGPDVLRRGQTIFFDANGRGPTPATRKAGYRRMSRPEYRLLRRSDELVEVAFCKPADDVFPFEMEWHYVLRLDSTQVDCFVVYRRDADSPPGSLIQTRMVMKLREELFTHYFVNDRTQGEFPKLTEPGATLKKVTDATVMFPGGRIATKYNLTDFEENHHVHGVAGPAGGVWVISPSNEYVNGGPTKQDLQVHEDSVIVLKMLHSGHFLYDSSLAFEGGEAWEKVYGPFAIYLNAQSDPQAAWADAKVHAARQQADWPCQWMVHPAFPLIRGQVTGRLMMDGKPATDGCVILAGPDGDWQVQGKGYQFRARTGSNGAFTIPKVRPGEYSLYAFVPGCAGELRKDGVTVEPNEAADLGDLTLVPLTHGRQIWQIGTADRTCGEFRYGGWPRQFGLWNRYLADFPNDVTFRIGAGEEATDWNYCQPVVQRSDGTWHVPTWRITFNLPAEQTGRATLMIGIAGATGNPELVVSVNGSEVGRAKLPNDGSVYRDATLAGHYRLWTVEFDAALLKASANEVSLQMIKSCPKNATYNPLSLPRAAIMYDFLRLELAP